MAASLERSARATGRHCWMEGRLFELLGGWVPTTAEPDAKLLLDRHSQHHAWRARQWWDRLPVLADVDRHDLVAGPDGLARAVSTIAHLDGTVARLAAAYRVVLPRLWASYERHRALASPAGDSATLRTLAIVGPDLAADWREGELVLEGMMSASDVAAAASAVATAETALMGADAGCVP